MSDLAKVVFLRGPKVILRPMSRNDLPQVLRWINDPEVRYFLESYLPVTEEEEAKWLANIGSGRPNDVMLAIETSDGVHIGNMGLHRIHWRDRVATTGAMIGEKEYWGKGYGTEAKMLLLYYAFYTLNLRKICSTVLSFNGRSIAYSKKCGYKEEGVLKDHVFRDGHYYDLVHLAVFRDDFIRLWEDSAVSDYQPDGFSQGSCGIG